MHKLLTKLLEKRGIKEVGDLTPEEKSDFDNWNAILSKEEMSIKDLKEFCQVQIDIIQQKWSDFSTPQAQKSELLPYFTVYNAILTAIDSPKAVRESVEKQLIQLTK